MSELRRGDDQGGENRSGRAGKTARRCLEIRMTYRPESALVTGASSGIGEAFAEALAARGTNLLLAARSDDRLQAVAKALRVAHGAQVETVSVDLSQRDGARTLQRAAIERGFEPDLLINN